jgi:CheY-like chemotaxis protein
MQDAGELTIQTFNVDLDSASLATHPGAHPGPYSVLAIRDTGHGMSEETQSHIFEPFFTTKDRGKGTGLGLATVYGTVNQSGGFIAVSSKIGTGTEIKIFLPRVEEPVEVTTAPEAPVQTRKGEGTILVVEDDDAVRRMTREFLKISGYTVLEARSGADAIHFMERRERPIDLVLTDVLMPGMKGRELVERLSKLRAGIKVLYMSAYTEDAAINIGVLSPGTAFIEKPFSPDDLANKVREVMNATGDGMGEKQLRHS